MDADSAAAKILEVLVPIVGVAIVAPPIRVGTYGRLQLQPECNPTPWDRGYSLVPEGTTIGRSSYGTRPDGTHWYWLVANLSDYGSEGRRLESLRACMGFSR